MKKNTIIALTALFSITIANAKEDIKVVDRTINSAKIAISAEKTDKITVFIKSGVDKFDAKSFNKSQKVEEKVDNAKSKSESEQIKKEVKREVTNGGAVDMKTAIKASDSTYAIFSDSGKSAYSIDISNLASDKKYDIEIYNEKPNAKPIVKEFYTLATEPIKQASNIGFKDVDDANISLMWMNGNGEGRIIVASKKGKITPPKDGIDYKADANFGKGSDIGDGSFVVFNGSKKMKAQATVSALTSGKYTFQIFEYNGKNESINYLTSDGKNNPRDKATSIAAPTSKEATELNASGFTANWTKVVDATGYELDVAKNSNFTECLEYYNQADVGDLDKMEVIELKPGTYYYRVRAISADSKSPHSKTITVEIK